MEELKKENKNKEEELNECEKKNEELKNENLRIYADFQNTKKRLEKERDRAIKHSHEQFSLDLLDVLDALYLAEEVIQNDKEREGIKNTIKKLENVFKKYHITETLYDIFDPNEHQAIQTVKAEDNQSSGDIVKVHRKGYKIHDKILRPAMVTVAED